jgi:uncharacterized protein DUF1579
MTFLIQLCLVAACAAAMFAQAPALDGPNHPFQDELLDHMQGSWRLTGTIARSRAEHSAEVDWVLNHQFLRIHEKAAGPTAGGRPAYEAMVFVGYDNASERYVAHWIDNFGGRFSETLGYGKKAGNAVEFVFEYPDGPFHTTFRWQPENATWQWEMRQKNSAGQWVPFADMTLTRSASR